VDSFIFTARYNRALFLARNEKFVPAAAQTLVIPLSAARAVEANPPFPRPTGTKRRVVCVTRLVGEESLKGLPSLVSAAKHLPPEWEVVIVGDGAARPALEKQAAALGVTGRIRFTGWLDNAARSKELAEAEVFCLPSAQEGFGIVFLEAMAAGRPSVGAAAGAIPEVLPHSAGEIFPFDDEVALAQAIVRAGDRFRSGELTPESIRGVYEERYAWGRFREAWTRHLNELRA
jgi:glycosyltransferase involved in cell wall biosynthesis